MITYCVPCVTFGMTREKLRGDGCLLYGFLYNLPIVACVLETKQRGEIRERRGIPGSTFADFMAVLCCPLCTLVQEEQEAFAMLHEQQRQQQHGATVIVAGGAQPNQPPMTRQ